MTSFILGFFVGFIAAEAVFLMAIWYDNNGRK